MNNSLLPPGSSAVEIAAAQACAGLSDMTVPLRPLWDADRCPVALLPYLAWAWSVDRWDESWSEATKRAVVKAAFYVHKHKGTIAALRRVVEPLGYLIRVIEWWQNNDPPGTFRLDIGVLDTGITEAMYVELERLIDQAKPRSRHLIGLSIQLATQGAAYVGAACYEGDELTVYPYLPDRLTVTGTTYRGGAVHLIDHLSITS
ncbi:phage tail protein I [Candidatus Regiella endosymbiont of Tuberolachnus salignus]|uniref:phage tail protein I n=1 Tax=Candidatus Regiella endosymbiont of Tuberolachnus salignus TaxID=3077956 RepID=UPI0030CE69F7